MTEPVYIYLTLCIVISSLVRQLYGQACTGASWQGIADTAFHQTSVSTLIQFGVDVENDCKKNCLDSITCVAFDARMSFWTTNCYFSLAFRPLVPFTGNTHYIYQKSCTTVVGTSCQFQSIGNYSAQTGAKVATLRPATDNDGCLIECAALAECEVATYQKDTTICYHYTTIDLAITDRYQGSDWSMYIKSTCTTVSTTTTSTTTTSTTASTTTSSATTSVSPEMIITLSNTSELIQNDDLTMTCRVESNPLSTIQLYNVTDNITPLDTVNSDNQAQLQLTYLHCLDTGDYRFNATNGVPNDGFMVVNTVHISVLCAPIISYTVPGVTEVSLPTGDSVTFAAGVISNPSVIIGTDNWEFRGIDDLIKPLPSNVVQKTLYDTQRLTHVAKLEITNIKENNYGAYIFKASNRIGKMEPVVFKLTIRVGINIPLIAGLVCGIVIVIIVIIILVVMVRNGKLTLPCQRTKKNKDCQTTTNTDSSVVIGDNTDLTSDGQIVLYSGLIDKPQTQPPSIYETIEMTYLPEYEAGCSKITGRISEGVMFNVLAATSKTANDGLIKSFVVKNCKDNDHTASTAYLKNAAECMMKLTKCHYVIHCHGIIKVAVGCELLLESAPLGNLRQYLVGVSQGIYQNTGIEEYKHKLLTFLRQILDGMAAVHSVNALFTCVSVDHVLLDKDLTCKMTSFAAADVIRARNKEEEHLKLSRPWRWLAPETSQLIHTQESDIWGLGVLIWELYSGGDIPYKDVEDECIRDHVMSGHPLPKPTIHPDEIIDLLNRCWMQSPNKRLKLDDVKSVINDMTVYQTIQ